MLQSAQDLEPPVKPERFKPSPPHTRGDVQSEFVSDYRLRRYDVVVLPIVPVGSDSPARWSFTLLNLGLEIQSSLPLKDPHELFVVEGIVHQDLSVFSSQFELVSVEL